MSRATTTSAKNYESFEAEYLEVCKNNGRDTKRKVLNWLRADKVEFADRVAHIEKGLLKGHLVWLHGEQYGKVDLYNYKRELQMTIKMIVEVEAGNIKIEKEAKQEPQEDKEANRARLQGIKISVGGEDITHRYKVEDTADGKNVSLRLQDINTIEVEAEEVEAEDAGTMTQKQIDTVQKYLDKKYKELRKSGAGSEKINLITWLYDQATHELEKHLKQTKI